MVSHTILLFTGTVIFYNNTVLNSIIVLTNKSNLVIDGKLQFTDNSAFFIIHFQHNSYEYIMINETSVVNINRNYLCTLFTTTSLVRTNPYPYCFFQYFSTSNLDNNVEHGKFSIKFNYNHYDRSFCMSNSPRNMPITNCQWLLPHSSFNTTLPLDVNNDYIQYTDSTGTHNRLPHVNEPNTLCVCTNTVGLQIRKSGLTEIFVKNKFVNCSLLQNLIFVQVATTRAAVYGTCKHVALAPRRDTQRWYLVKESLTRV